MDIALGLIFCIIIGAAAWGVSHFVPLGAVTLAIILGLLIANLTKVPVKAKKGIVFSEKKILSAAIALLGFSLNYRVLFSLGFLPLAAVLLGVPVTIFTALGWGRLMGMERDLALLVGTGNGICGSSAIAAVQGVIKTDEEHVGVSVAVINLLGTVGIFLIPLIVSLFPGLTEQLKGLVIGNTIQAVGQVTAAGFSLGDVTGQTAAVVKMGRILLITPVALILSFIRKPAGAEGEGDIKLPGVPPFILLFILFSLVNTLGILPEEVVSLLKQAGEWLLIVAMAGIGMKITFRGLATQGKKALCAGILTWAVQISFSLLLIWLYFHILA